MRVYQVSIYRPGFEACPLIGQSNVVVNALPELMPYTLTKCEETDSMAANGITDFDLTQIENAPNLIYTYYESIEAYNNGEFILDPQAYTNTEPFIQYVYYQVTTANGCENLDEIQLQVIETPNAVLDTIYQLCVGNPNLNLNVSTIFDTYAWYKKENNNERLISAMPEVQIKEVGDYILRVGLNHVNYTDDIICGQTLEFTVVPYSFTTIKEVVINDNAEINTVEIRLEDRGDYEFSIDGMLFQNSGYFNDVPSGTITVYVRDKNGCGLIERNIDINEGKQIGVFPLFFTPNGDGINDFWQYIPPDPPRETKIDSIEIYNRFGYLIAIINIDSKGWDGEVNGVLSIESDYWYQAIDSDGKIYNGHFTLKR